MIQTQLSFEQFQLYNFVLYEQFLFRNLLSIYHDQKVKYKLLAINIFNEREKAPILIDLKSMNDSLLNDFYHEIYLKEKTSFVSVFDYIGLVQNLIKTDMTLDDLAEKLTALMVINDRQLFRFYDPRVLIHVFLLNYRNKSLTNSVLKEWISRFQSTCDEWCISPWGHSIILNKNNFAQFEEQSIYSTISIEYFGLVNQQIKNMVNTKQLNTIHQIVEMMQALHIELEVNNDR